MKRAVAMLIAVLVGGVGFLVAMGRTESDAVKVCRTNTQRFTQEMAGFKPGLDSLYSVTPLGQRSIAEFHDRDDQLTRCIQTDPGHHDEYQAILSRDRDIEGRRYLKFLLDTDQMQNYEAYERIQQAGALAKNPPKSGTR